MRRLAVVLAICLACTSPTRAPAATTPRITLVPSLAPGALQIFDMHLHYSREAWDAYPAQTVGELLNANGVRGALVSSAPDEGSFRLKSVLGDRIVPTLGPYRNRGDPQSWSRDPSILAYVQSVYRPGVHRGFGEFHLRPGEVAFPVVRSVLEFAAREKLFLHFDGNAEALAELLEAAPEATILWAHAGTDAKADEVSALLDRAPRLSVELSYRDFDMKDRGDLNPLWSPVLLKHGERFMVGTDTWIVDPRRSPNDRWEMYADVIKEIRGWLKLLPADVAERIAHENAERFIAELPR